MSKVIRECIAFTELCLVITLENLATSYYLSPGLGREGGHMVFRGNGGFVVVNGVLRGHDRQYYMALEGSQVNFIVIKPKFSGPPSFSSSIKNDRSIT